MNKSNRIESLDSIRGLAAASVVLLHCLLPIPFIWDMVTTGSISDLQSSNPSTVFAFIFTYSPLHIFWDGGAAVILFFVLSGLVLTLPFFSGRDLNYPTYIIRRFFRIYIPYIVSLFVAFILLSLTKNGQSLSQLSQNFNSLWQDPLTFQTIVNHIFMIGDTAGKEALVLNGVIWTLVHEMRFSIILPLLLIPIARLSWKYSLSIPVVIFFVSRYLLNTAPDSEFVEGLYETLFYSSFFTMGILVSKYLKQIKSFYQHLNSIQKIILILVTILLYNWQWGIGFLSPINSVKISQWMSGVGATLIICLALSSLKFSNFLERKTLVWLGKISFSLYLVHSPILLASVYLLHHFIPVWVILIFVPALSLVAAAVFYKYVETYSVKAGKTFTTLPYQHSRVGETKNKSS